MTILDQIEAAMSDRTKAELALGFVRYEALRKLSPFAFAELCRVNHLQGRPFDDLVDELVAGKEIKT